MLAPVIPSMNGASMLSPFATKIKFETSILVGFRKDWDITICWIDKAGGILSLLVAR